MTAAVSGAPITLPRSFGRYVLFDFIGKGGMAEIYLARQKTDLGAARLCVVKQILPGLAGNPQFSEMLVHEAKLAARLSHANVVQVFDLGRADGRLFIAMEYVEGFDLNNLLRRCSRAKVALPFERFAMHVVREALRGLDYAHRRTDDAGKPLGIVHQDVSPSNLLLSFDGEVKVCDFGIAHANDTVRAGAARHELRRGHPRQGRVHEPRARARRADRRARRRVRGGDRHVGAGRGTPHVQTRGGARLADRACPARRGAGADDLRPPQEPRLRGIVGKALAPDRANRYPSAAAMLREAEEYAMAARLMSSHLQLGDWLERTFGEDILARRRSRERAAAALERGAPVVVQALAPAPAAEPVTAPEPATAPEAVVPVASPPVPAPPAPGPLPVLASARPVRSRGRGALVAMVILVVVAVAALVRLRWLH